MNGECWLYVVLGGNLKNKQLLIIDFRNYEGLKIFHRIKTLTHKFCKQQAKKVKKLKHSLWLE